MARGAALALCGCAFLPVVNPPVTNFDGVTQTIPLDGVTQSTPLVVGNVSDGAGKPVAGAEVVAFVGRQLAAVGSSTDLTATTDAAGKFVFKDLPTGEVTFEASKDGRKAIKLSIPVVKGVRQVDLGVLALADPGILRGKVVVPQGESALGIDVYVPGTRFVAKTDDQGRYTLDGLPPASYRVVATKERYAAAVSEASAVEAGKTADVADLVLSLDAPAISSLSADFGAYGQEITITGAGFGKGRSLPFDVFFGTARAATLERVSDTEIRAGIPYNAVNAPVTAVVNGVSSTGAAFRVIRSVKWGGAVIEAKNGEPKTLSIDVLDSAAQSVQASPTFVVDPPTLGQIEAGSFLAAAPGTGSIRVSVGQVAAESKLFTSRYWVEPFASGLSAMPTGLAVLGNLLYLALGDTVDRVTDGVPTTCIGTNPVSNSDGTPVSDFQIKAGADIEFDADGNLFITNATTGFNRVLFVPAVSGSRFGLTVEAGKVYAILGAVNTAENPKLRGPIGLALRADGTVAICDADSVNRVRFIHPDGTIGYLLGGGTETGESSGIATESVALDGPRSVAYDPSGNLFVGDNSRIWMVPAAGGTYFGRQLIAGKAYLLAGTGLTDLNPDGPASEVNLFTVGGILPDGNSLLFTDMNHQRVRSLDSDGLIRTLVGGGPDQVNSRTIGTRASFTSLGDLERSQSGAIFVADPGLNRALRLD